MSFYRALVSGLVSLSLLCSAWCAAEQAGTAPEVRATYVTRWDYKTPEDVKQIIKNCRDYHLNVLIFQVRGNATAFYPSKLEPWAWELTGEDVSTLGKDPGWDPLTLACKEAHARGIELHAWMNVFPAWKQPTPPPEQADHLWNTHRDWFMQNAQGEVMWPQDWWDYWYTFVDPGVPAVKTYLQKVFLEVAENFPVDGLHYDYVRYPHEVGDWAYNATSVARFTQAYKAKPAELPVQWDEWKRSQITDLVQKIYFDTEKVKPRIVISASIMYDWPRAHNDYSQDNRTWLSRGVVDMTCPMLYIQDKDAYTAYLRDLTAHRYGRWVVPNLGVFRIRDTQLLLEMIDIARQLGAAGIGLYDYKALFPKHQPGEKAKALLAGPFATWVETPPMPWKKPKAAQ